MWLEMWAFREVFFHGDKLVETYNSICNQSKDQVNDARHEVNLVSYKGGSTRDTGYLYIPEMRDSQNLAKLGHGCNTKLSDRSGEGIEFRFNWRCGWVATMVPNWELRSTFWFPVPSM